MENQTQTPVADSGAPPEDYKAYLEWHDKGGATESAETEETEQTPAAGEEAELSSESTEESQSDAASESETAEAEGDEADQTAAESETAENEEGQESQPAEGKKLARRMRKLTGTIAQLQARIDELTSGEGAGENADEEVASSTETTEAAPADAPKRPLLRDFEDTEEQTAWEQYEAAMEAYNEARTQAVVDQALAKQRQALDNQHAQQMAQQAWNTAASRYPNFNEVVAREEVKISSAMESVMRMDPVKGTDIAYYLGQHPEESERIAKLTLANNEREWPNAVARAALELGAIAAKATPPAAGAKKTPPSATPAPKPQPKQQTSRASKPPVQVKGVATPRTDVHSDDDAADYRKWSKAREAQLKQKR